MKALRRYLVHHSHTMATGRLCLFLTAFLFASAITFGQTTTTSITTGNWNAGGTWDNGVPGNGDNAIIASGDVVTLAGNEIINDLTIESGATLIDNNKTLTVNGNFTLDGTFDGKKTLTLAGAGAIIDGFGNKTNMGGVTISSGKTIATTANLNFTKGNVTISNGATVTNNGTVTFNDRLQGGGATAIWVNASNSTLNIGREAMVTGTLTADATGNTVSYYRNNGQVIKQPSGSYYNLDIAGLGIKTLEGATSVLGDLTISSTLDVVPGSNWALNVAGDWINTGTFEEQNGTVTFDGAGAQSITNTSSGTFYNLTVDKGGGILTLSENHIVSNTLSMPVTNSGNIDASTGTLTLGTGCGVEGTLAYSSGAILGKFERWVNFTTPVNYQFPVGISANVRPALLTVNTLGTCGTVIAEFVETGPGGNGLPLRDGLALPDSIRNTFVEGYWTMTAGNGLVTSSYDLELTGNGLTSFTPNASTRLLTRTGSAAPWTGEGTHVAAVGNTARRTAITYLPSQHAFGDTINCSAPPPVAITGDSIVCPLETSVAYSVPFTSGSIYTWTITGGAQASGTNTNSITVDWGSTGMIANVRVVENNGCTDAAPVDFIVAIPTLTPAGITGKSNAAENTLGEPYSVEFTPGYTYAWTIAGGAQASGGTTNSITVDWGAAGAGDVSVIADSGSCASAPSVSLPVNIYVVIETIAGGDWDDPTIWNCTCVPGAFDNVRINNFHTVTLRANGKISSIIIETNGIIFDNNKRMDISGDFTVKGTYTGSGQLKIKGSGNVIDGTGLISTSGSLRLEGGSTSITSTSVLTKSPGIVELRSGHTVTNNGSFVIGGNLVGQDATITWINASNSKLVLSGILLATGTLSATATGNTVEYNGGASQTFKPVDYYHVSSTGAATHVLGADMIAYGDVNISAVNTMNSAGFDIQVRGDWTNAGGTFVPSTGITTFNGTSGAQTITATGGETFGNLTIAGGSTVNIPSGSSASVATSLVNSGTIDNDGTLSLAIGYDGQTGTLSGDGTHTLTGGNWNNTGTFTAESSTVLMNGGTAQTIQGATTFNNLTIDNASNVSITADAHDIINTLTLTSGNFATNNALTFISNSSGTGRIAEITGGSISGDITMQRFIAGDDDWRLLASPVNGSSLSGWNSNFSMSGFPGSNDPSMSFVSVVSYDETILGIKDSGFVTPSGIGDGLGTGKGWFTWVGKSLGAAITLTTDLTGPATTGSQVLATSYTDSPELDDHDGWNLLGNPFPSDILWDNVTLSNVRPFAYVWDPNGDSYVSYDQSSGNTIPSMQAFWVKGDTPGAGTVTINENDKATDGDNFYKTTPVPGFSLILTGNGYTDSTRIRLDDDATENYDPMYDAFKLYSLNPDKANISSVTADSVPVELSISTIPELNGAVSIPIKIGFSSAVGFGTYTIKANLNQLSGTSCILLEDLVTNTLTDLRQDSSYSFNQFGNVNQAARFVLHVGAPVSASITDIACNGANNGQIVADFPLSNVTYTWLNANLDTIETTFSSSGSDTISGLVAGEYTLLVSSPGSLCQTPSQTYIVTEATPMEAINTVSNPLCHGDETGTIDLSTNGGTPNYVYQWNNGKTTEDITGLAAGNYSVTITDLNGCSLIKNVNLTSPSEIQNVVTVTNELCAGQENGEISLILSGGILPYQYIWADGSTGPLRSNLVDGSYAVTITDANGCTLEETDLIVEPGTEVLAGYTIPSSTLDLSQGGTLQFTNISIGATSYTWDFGTGETSSLEHPMYTFSNPGEYEVQLTSMNGTCFSTSSNVITVTSSVGLSEDALSTTEFEVYQGNGVLNLKFDLEDRINAQITVYNILGQVVWNYFDLSVHKDNIALNLEGISQGVYTVQISTSEHRFIKKITIK